MPRFSIKDLLLATTLIAVGVGAESFLIRSPNAYRGSGEIRSAILMLFGYCGGACIGAGLLLPFKRPLFGLAIGFAMQSFLIAAILIFTLR
jgi:hypothetical protein